MKKRLDPDNTIKEKIDVSTGPGEAPTRESAGDRLLSIKEVAAFFGVHAKTIRRWATRSENKLAGSKPGGKWMFRWRVVQKFADDNEVGT